MKPARFAMERPRDLAAALSMIAGADGATKILAGGQSLGPMLNLRLVEPDHVIDISGVPELRRIDRDNGALVIGACVTHADIEDGRAIPWLSSRRKPRARSKSCSRSAPAVSKLRSTLGESLASVQKFDVPIEQVTTASLDALKAFALGVDAEFDRGRLCRRLPFYRRAVELDPNFAWVYARMGTVYANAGGRLELAKQYTRKAYELKDRVSEREKLYIMEHYYETVTGELDKEIETLELYDRTYPTDSVPGNNLAIAYSQIGEYGDSGEGARRGTGCGPQFAKRVLGPRSSITMRQRAVPTKRSRCWSRRSERFPKNSEDIHWAAFWVALSLDKHDEAQRQLTWGEGKLTKIHLPRNPGARPAGRREAEIVGAK